jgi:hypothetical protein
LSAQSGPPKHFAIIQRAFAALPTLLNAYYFRGDSACWEKNLLSWLRDEQRVEGPQGRITFDISVGKQPNLKKHIERLQEYQWQATERTAGLDNVRVC